MPSTTDFVPAKEATLVAFVDNFATRLSAAPTSMGCTATQATAFQTLVTAFKASWILTENHATRSGAGVIVKNQNKVAMVKQLRALARIIQAYPGTTNDQRALMGLTVPAVRQKHTPPTEIPVVESVSIVGNTVTIRAHGQDTTRRAKPANCKQLVVFSYVGAQPPTQPTDWLYQGASGRTLIQVAFNTALPMGTKVWVAAAWANDAGPGNASPAMGAVLLGTNASPTSLSATTSNLSIAA